VQGAKASVRKKKEKNMKNTLRFLIAGAAITLLTAAGQAQAGGSDSCSKDGTAASPKLRTLLDERCKSQCAAPAQATVSTTIRQTEFAASPKVQQTRNERAYASTPVITTETAGYRPTAADGITASPKVRAQLDEHRESVQVAPVK
jgi:hypothetical protein